MAGICSCYFVKYVISFIEHTLLISVDDKAIVPVGEPEGHHRSLVFSFSRACGCCTTMIFICLVLFLR